jgi:hypothetical protein
MNRIGSIYIAFGAIADPGTGSHAYSPEPSKLGCK